MNEVIVYSQPSCGECQMVKAFLKHKGIEFQEKNIREDKEAYDKLIEAKFRSTPVTFINGKAIPGFNPEEIEKELGLE